MNAYFYLQQYSWTYLSLHFQLPIYMRVCLSAYLTIYVRASANANVYHTNKRTPKNTRNQKIGK